MLEEFGDIMSVEETCEALKMGHNAVCRLLSSGELKAFRNGSVWRIPKEAVKSYIMEKAKLTLK